MASLRGVNESFLRKKSSEQAISYRSILKSGGWNGGAMRLAAIAGIADGVGGDGIASLACGFIVAPQFTGVLD